MHDPTGEKNQLHEFHGVQFLKRFSAKFESLNVQIRNNFTLFCRNFKFVIFYAFFPTNLYSQNFRFKKNGFFLVCAWQGGKVEVVLLSQLFQSYMLCNLDVVSQIHNRPSTTVIFVEQNYDPLRVNLVKALAAGGEGLGQPPWMRSKLIQVK